MTVAQTLGFFGTGLVIAGYVPQVFHLVKERCTSEQSSNAGEREAARNRARIAPR
jgi:hypothetical protein